MGIPAMTEMSCIGRSAVFFGDKLVQSVNNCKMALDRAIEMSRVKQEKEDLLSRALDSVVYVGTGYFRTEADLQRYYGSEANDAIAEGRVQVGLPLHIDARFGYWDHQGRWHIKSSPLLPQGVEFHHATNAVQHAEMDRAKASDLSHLANVQRWWLRRMQVANPIFAAVKTQTAFRKLFEEKVTNWEEELPYCMRGQPLYSRSQYEEEEMKPLNNRVIWFDWKDKKDCALIVLRNIGEPTDTHWGMINRPALLFTVINGYLLEVESMNQILNLLKMPDQDLDEGVKAQKGGIPNVE
jgi:hypothetical protein